MTLQDRITEAIRSHRRPQSITDKFREWCQAKGYNPGASKGATALRVGTFVETQARDLALTLLWARDYLEAQDTTEWAAAMTNRLRRRCEEIVRCSLSKGSI